jgi:hypothetical protein
MVKITHQSLKDFNNLIAPLKVVIWKQTPFAGLTLTLYFFDA